MGVVLLAHHVELGQPVAIKALRRELADNPEARGRFEREARAAASLTSEHVAHVTDVGRMPDGTPFMVMEYLDGEDLASRVDRDGPLDVPFAIECILQACEGLGEAHEKGIVHRDVKPSNLFLVKRPNGRFSLKVLDFGIAKAASVGGAELTRTSAIIGSPLYMSPEQLRESRDVDSRTDVWSLGVTLFYLLTKRFPFEAEAVGEIYGKIIFTEPTPLHHYAPQVPAELAIIVAQCLKKDSADRVASVAALASLLTKFRSAPPPSAPGSYAQIPASRTYLAADADAAHTAQGLGEATPFLAASRTPGVSAPAGAQRSGATTLAMETHVHDETGPASLRDSPAAVPASPQAPRLSPEPPAELLQVPVKMLALDGSDASDASDASEVEPLPDLRPPARRRFAALALTLFLVLGGAFFAVRRSPTKASPLTSDVPDFGSSPIPTTSVPVVTSVTSAPSLPVVERVEPVARVERVERVGRVDNVQTAPTHQARVGAAPAVVAVVRDAGVRENARNTAVTPVGPPPADAAAARVPEPEKRKPSSVLDMQLQ